MSIDNFTDAGIKIQDLAISEPLRRPEPIFDIKRDVTDEQWEKVDVLAKNAITRLRILPDDSNSSLELVYLQGFALVAPDLAKKHMTEFVWDKLHSSIQNADPEKSIDALYLLILAATLKVIDPQRARRQELINENQWEKIKASFDEDQNYGMDQRGVLQMAGQVRIASPERAHDFDLSEDTWQYSINALSAYQERIDKHPDYLENFASWIMDVKLVDPKKVKDFTIKDTTWERIWESEKNKFGKMNEIEVSEDSLDDKQFDLGYRLPIMAVLAAEDIKPSDKGVELVFPAADGQLHPDTKPIPERRMF